MWIEHTICVCFVEILRKLLKCPAVVRRGFEHGTACSVERRLSWVLDTLGQLMETSDTKRRGNE